MENLTSSIWPQSPHLEDGDGDGQVVSDFAASLDTKGANCLCSFSSGQGLLLTCNSSLSMTGNV